MIKINKYDKKNKQNDEKCKQNFKVIDVFYIAIITKNWILGFDGRPYISETLLLFEKCFFNSPFFPLFRIFFRAVIFPLLYSGLFVM